MNKSQIIIAVAALIIAVLAASIFFKPKSSLIIEDAAIALGIDNHLPLKPGTIFKSNAGRIYCYTKVSGMNAEEKSITHRWFYGSKLMAEVPLKIKSSPYRTYSTKVISKEMTGDWSVEITAPGGRVLKTLKFAIE